MNTSTNSAAKTLCSMTMLCLLSAAVMAGDTVSDNTQPEPELLMFIAAFSERGRFIDPLAVDQMMTQIAAEPVTESTADVVSDQALPQPGNDEYEVPDHEQQ